MAEQEDVDKIVDNQTADAIAENKSLTENQSDSTNENKVLMEFSVQNDQENKIQAHAEITNTNEPSCDSSSTVKADMDDTMDNNDPLSLNMLNENFDSSMTSLPDVGSDVVSSVILEADMEVFSNKIEPCLSNTAIIIDHEKQDLVNPTAIIQSNSREPVAAVDLNTNITGTKSDQTPSKKPRPDSVVRCEQELEQVHVASKEMTAQSPSTSRESESSSYHLKWFEWKGEQTPVVTQNENGPCPLLAIANVLILAHKIVLPKMQQLISAKQLMEYIGDCILSEAPKQEGNDELILNYQQNMQDAIDIMHKLQTGIDVNVKFSGVTDFEFTRECIVFDLLKIVLYHGWLVDPQDEATMKLVHGLSYNQLVEKMLLSKDGEGEKIVEGLVMEEFLNRTASQLTYYGLCGLNESIQEEELCVFFRNNHFSTLYKHKGELFILVTDQGFLTEPAVSWETLINIEGDGQFVNSHFKTVTLQNSGFTTVSKPIDSSSDNTPGTMLPNPIDDANMSQEDRDYLIALSLQEDERVHQPSQPSSKLNTAKNIDTDLALAMKLQEDEDRLAREEQQSRQQRQNQNQNVQRDSTSQSASNRQASEDPQQQQQRNQNQGENPDKSKCSIS